MYRGETLLKNIILEKKEQIAKLIFNRPRVLNAINSEMRQEFIHACEDIKNDKSIKALILTGMGDRAFSAGQDLNETRKLTGATTPSFMDEWEKTYSAIRNQDIPTVSAINGFAVGAACQLAILTDIRIASENAKLGFKEISVGMPCIVGTGLLWDVVGQPKTVELILTADLINAKEAERIGLVNKVVPANELENAAIEMAKKLASQPQTGIKLTKQWQRRLTEKHYRATLAAAKELHTKAYSSGAPQEEQKAFFEERTRRKAKK